MMPSSSPSRRVPSLPARQSMRTKDVCRVRPSMARFGPLSAPAPRRPRVRPSHNGNYRRLGGRSNDDDDPSTVLLPNRSLSAASGFSYYGGHPNGGDTVTTSSGSELDANAQRGVTCHRVAPQRVEKWSSRQKRILAIILLATLTSSFAVCLFPPFFPRLSEEKGSSATVYGFIIGTNCLTSFLVTPFVGKNLTKCGVRYCFVWGMLIGSMCCTLSGFLEFFCPGWEFVITAVFLRIVHATGNALVITSTFTYSALEFENSIGKIFSLTRAAMNLAQLLGPLVGGAIYQGRGFYVPFVFMGGMQFFMGMVSVVFLPEIRKKKMSKSSTVDEPNLNVGKKLTILNVLKIPTIWFSFVTFIIATMCNGFLSINLEPKVLRVFDLKPFSVGLLFGIKDGANSISSPLWGYFCDKNRKSSVKPFVVFSTTLVAMSFILMGAGAVIGVQFQLTLPVLVFALCLNGVGIGGEQVAGVVDALHEAENAGYPNDPSMHGLVAGLWSSLSGAGRFVSRVGSGFLVDRIGFKPTAAVFTTLQAIIAAATLTYMAFCECTLKHQRSVHWQDVTVIQEDGSNDDVVMFTESASPSESIMDKTVSIDVPKSTGTTPRARNSRSLPHHSISVQSAVDMETGGLGETGNRVLAHSLLAALY